MTDNGRTDERPPVRLGLSVVDASASDDRLPTGELTAPTIDTTIAPTNITGDGSNTDDGAAPLDKEGFTDVLHSAGPGSAFSPDSSDDEQEAATDHQIERPASPVIGRHDDDDNIYRGNANNLWHFHASDNPATHGERTHFPPAVLPTGRARHQARTPSPLHQARNLSSPSPEASPTKDNRAVQPVAAPVFRSSINWADEDEDEESRILFEKGGDVDVRTAEQRRFSEERAAAAAQTLPSREGLPKEPSEPDQNSTVTGQHSNQAQSDQATSDEAPLPGEFSVVEDAESQVESLTRTSSNDYTERQAITDAPSDQASQQKALFGPSSSRATVRLPSRSGLPSSTQNEAQPGTMQAVPEAQTDVATDVRAATREPIEESALFEPFRNTPAVRLPQPLLRKANVVEQSIASFIGDGSVADLSPEETSTELTPFTTTGRDGAFGRPQTRHVPVEEIASSEAQEVRQPPQEPGTLDSPAEGEMPTSPTPSDAESVDSLTGMTQADGLAAADEYNQRSQQRATQEEAEEFLRKQRAMLRFANEDNLNRAAQSAMKGLKNDDPQETIELLKTKVHSYREQRDAYRAQWDRERDNFTHMEQYFMNSLQDREGRLSEAMDEADSHAQAAADSEKRRRELDGKIAYLEMEIEMLQGRVADEEARAAQWKKSYEHNYGLANKWRDHERGDWKQEYVPFVAPVLNTQYANIFRSASTDTDDLPRSLEADANRRTDASTQTPDPGAQTTQRGTGTPAQYVDSSTQMDSPTENQTQTQTQTPPSQTRSVGVQTINSSNAAEPMIGANVFPSAQGHILPRGTVRWAAEHLDDLSVALAGWITRAHRSETNGRSDMEPLNAELARDILDDGTLSFEQLVNALRLMGYQFRHDRLAQWLLADEQITSFGRPSIEVMFAARQMENSQNPLAELLDEIRRIEDGQPVGEASRLNGELAALGMQLGEYTEANTELQETVGRLRGERNMARDDRDALQGEHDELRDERDTLQDEQDILRVEYDSLREAHDLLMLQLKDCDQTRTQLREQLSKAPTQDTPSDDTDIKRQLDECHRHGANLTREIVELNTELLTTRAKLESLDYQLAERTRDVETWKTEAEAQQRVTVQLQTSLDQCEALRKVAADRLEALMAARSQGSLTARTSRTPSRGRSPALGEGGESQTPPQVPQAFPQSPGRTPVRTSTSVTPSIFTRPSKWVEREREIRASAAYQQRRAELPRQRQAERAAEQARYDAVERYVAQSNWGVDRVPYVPVEQRWVSAAY